MLKHLKHIVSMFICCFMPSASMLLNQQLFIHFPLPPLPHPEQRQVLVASFSSWHLGLSGRIITQSHEAWTKIAPGCTFKDGKKKKKKRTCKLPLFPMHILV